MVMSSGLYKIQLRYLRRLIRKLRKGLSKEGEHGVVKEQSSILRENLDITEVQI